MNPEDFYGDQELNSLEPYLIVQSEIFPPGEKYWEWNKYEQFIDGDIEVKRMFLTGESIDPALVEICLSNPNHYYYCGWRRTSLVDSRAVFQVSAVVDQRQSREGIFQSILETIGPTLLAGNKFAVDGSSALLTDEQVISIVKRAGGRIVYSICGHIDYIVRGGDSAPNLDGRGVKVLSHAELLMMLMNKQY